MKKTSLIILPLIVVVLFAGFLQNNPASDYLTVYELIIKKLNRQSKIRVSPLTSKTLIKDFNFKNPSYHLVDTISKRSWQSSQWRIFLSNIDTSKVNDYELKSNGKFWFKNVENQSSKKYATFVLFSPIIFSNDYTKAICLTRTYKGGAGSLIVWFYEKENSIWTYKDSITISIYD